MIWQADVPYSLLLFFWRRAPRQRPVDFVLRPPDVEPFTPKQCAEKWGAFRTYAD